MQYRFSIKTKPPRVETHSGCEPEYVILGGLALSGAYSISQRTMARSHSYFTTPPPVVKPLLRARITPGDVGIPAGGHLSATGAPIIGPAATQDTARRDALVGRGAGQEDHQQQHPE